MEENEVCVGYEIRRLDNAIKKRIDGVLKTKGLDEATVTNGWILRYLYDNRDKYVYQKDIEKHFNMGRSTVTGIIKVMESHELIKRESVDDDARLKRVILLPKGEEVHKIISKVIYETNVKLVEGVSSEELNALLQILTKIGKNI